MPNEDGVCRHTPGPWHIDLETPFTLGGDSRSVDALTPDGTMVTREVASLMFDTDEWPDGEGWLEDAANARLIASAPDLLKLVEMAIRMSREVAASEAGHLAMIPESVNYFHEVAEPIIAKVAGK